MTKFISKDFDDVLEAYESLIATNGFTKESKKVYVSDNNIEIQFVIDKWGWSEDQGSRFVIRVTDRNKFTGEGEYRFYTDAYDVSLDYLLSNNLVSKQKLAEYQELYFGSHEPMEQDHWIPFYDKPSLAYILDIILSPILERVRNNKK